MNLADHIKHDDELARNAGLATYPHWEVDCSGEVFATEDAIIGKLVCRTDDPPSAEQPIAAHIAAQSPAITRAKNAVLLAAEDYRSAKERVRRAITIGAERVIGDTLTNTFDAQDKAQEALFAALTALQAVYEEDAR